METADWKFLIFEVKSRIKQMTKKTRTILFVLLVILFLVLAPLITFYSWGYRFDWESKKITATGAFYFKVLPKSSQIYLNGKLAKKTDFFFGSAYLENLLPKKYQIKIQKDGFHPWEKSLEIKEREITRLENIVLFTQSPNFTFLTKNVLDFFVSPDQKKIVLKEIDGKNWSLKLFEPGQNIKSQLIKDKDIAKTEVDLISLEFSPDSKEISLKVIVGEETIEYSLNLEKTPPILVKKKNMTIPDNVLTYQADNNGNIYYLDNQGYVFKADQSFLPLAKINDAPFKAKQETEYKINVLPDNLLLLQETKTPYLFNPAAKSFEKFSDSIKGLKVSPDNKKFAYFSDSEIWVYFLKDQTGQPLKKAGEKIFLSRFSEKINELFWLNDNYLVFNTGDKIKIAETDDRDKINTVDLTDFPGPKIYWSNISKKLFILSDNSFYSSSNLLP